MEQVDVGDIQIFSEIRLRFIKANLQAKLARLLGYPQSPLNLDHVAQWMGLKGTCDLGLAPVDLSRVVGTQGDCTDFDRAFRPRIGGVLQAEWELFGDAILRGLEPPALKLYQWGDAFFVLNRHERVLVSVLKAFGQRIIQAYVIEPDKARVPPPTIKFLEQWEREVQRDLRQRTLDVVVCEERGDVRTRVIVRALEMLEGVIFKFRLTAAVYLGRFIL